jgi:hypothetical protein
LMPVKVFAKDAYGNSVEKEIPLSL